MRSASSLAMMKNGKATPAPSEITTSGCSARSTPMASTRFRSALGMLRVVGEKAGITRSPRKQ